MDFDQGCLELQSLILPSDNPKMSKYLYIKLNLVLCYDLLMISCADNSLRRPYYTKLLPIFFSCIASYRYHTQYCPVSLMQSGIGIQAVHK